MAPDRGGAADGYRCADLRDGRSANVGECSANQPFPVRPSAALRPFLAGQALGHGIIRHEPVERTDGGERRAAGKHAPRDPLDRSDIDCLDPRSEEHTSELQSLMRISYAVFCLKNKNT